MKRPFANRGLDSASRASKACVRHGCVNQRPIRKEAIPYGWRELRRDSRFEEFDGSFGIALQRATIIPRILERERHALVGSSYALAGGRHVRRDMNALVGRHVSVNGRVPTNARATVTAGDNTIPNAQSTLLSKHNSHGGLFLRRFRNAPDAASATTTFLRWRRFPKWWRRLPK